jgi:hypothetical protein
VCWVALVRMDPAAGRLTATTSSSCGLRALISPGAEPSRWCRIRLVRHIRRPQPADAPADQGLDRGRSSPRLIVSHPHQRHRRSPGWRPHSPQLPRTRRPRYPAPARDGAAPARHRACARAGGDLAVITDLCGHGYVCFVCTPTPPRASASPTQPGQPASPLPGIRDRPGVMSVTVVDTLPGPPGGGADGDFGWGFWRCPLSQGGDRPWCHGASHAPLRSRRGRGRRQGRGRSWPLGPFQGRRHRAPDLLQTACRTGAQTTTTRSIPDAETRLTGANSGARAPDAGVDLRNFEPRTP